MDAPVHGVTCNHGILKIGVARGLPIGYTLGMKTAISIPDPLFQAAEMLAQRQHLSRSALYAKALQSYVAANEERALTEAYNRVYTSENGQIDAAVIDAQFALLPDEGW